MSPKRLLIPVLLLALVCIFGTIGYYLLGIYGLRMNIIPQSWSIMDCIFMTAISLTTVGYGDVLGIYEHHYYLAEIYTIFLLFIGMGVVLYVVSEATSFLVEGHLKKIVERRRTLKSAKDLKNHIILCGLGDTGSSALTELITVGETFIAIDESEEACQKITEQFPGILTLHGNAWEESELQKAGIERARGIIACLSDDRDNVLLTVTARVMNPSIRIVARAKSLSSESKLKAAGASSVVTPTFNGGLRLASEMIRPNVTSFLDQMLRGKDVHRFSEIEVKETSQLIGTKLSQAGIRQKTGLNLIALKDRLGNCFYNVDVERMLESGDILIAVGTPQMIEKLKALCS